MFRDNVCTTYSKISKIDFLVFPKNPDSIFAIWHFRYFGGSLLVMTGIWDFGGIQPWSAVGSELRDLVRTLRRLIPSKQPMGQLRTQWRCRENSETASSSSKRPWNFEFFDVTFWTIFGRFSVDFRPRTRQNVVAVTWVWLWKKLLRRDDAQRYYGRWNVTTYECSSLEMLRIVVCEHLSCPMRKPGLAHLRA